MDRRERLQGNIHPTCKPQDLLVYLARMILPPERNTPRRALVPFSGSGSEALACLKAGFEEVVLIDLVPNYNLIARTRLEHWLSQPMQGSLLDLLQQEVD